MMIVLLLFLQNLSGELCDKLILWFFHCQAGNDTARLAMISNFKHLEKLEKEMMQVFFEGSETISRLGASQKCVNLQSAQDPPHTPGDHVCAVCFILL